MTTSKLLEILQLGVDNLPFDVSYKIGALTDLELFLSEDEYRLPFIFLQYPEQSSTQIPFSNASINNHSITGVVFIDYDVDSTDEQRLKAQIEANNILTRFVMSLRETKLNDGNWFSNVSVSSTSPLFRQTNGIMAGLGFVIQGTAANLFDNCCE